MSKSLPQVPVAYWWSPPQGACTLTLPPSSSLCVMSDDICLGSRFCEPSHRDLAGGASLPSSCNLVWHMLHFMGAVQSRIRPPNINR